MILHQAEFLRPQVVPSFPPSIHISYKQSSNKTKTETKVQQNGNPPGRSKARRGKRNPKISSLFDLLSYEGLLGPLMAGIKEVGV
jgi:hypothetical protein